MGVERAEKVQAIAELFEELSEEFLNLSQSLGIADTDLKAVAYETIATEETTITKHTTKGIKFYHYTQLKGYKDGKTYTLKSWREGQAPALLLADLVRLYRACRHLKKALEYL